MTAIIILNWNGADDTLACLSSLSCAEGDFVVYVVDNGSTDDSVARISSWIDEHGGGRFVLVPLERNYGFAVGNNKGLAVARNLSPDKFLLLNNDTEVERDFLVRLEDFSAKNPEYKVLTPRIHFFYDKNKIWNCGGRLSFSFRKYYYAGMESGCIKEKHCIPITFVTGCALYFAPELLDDKDRLFTERFFFGEEDFEFSSRMKAAKVKMACVLDSLIYHKVGSSGNKMVAGGKLYLHYLNRFIDVRLSSNRLYYIFWAAVNIPLCLMHFRKSSRSFKKAVFYMKHLLSDAWKKDGVTYEDFRSLVIKGNYFE